MSESSRDDTSENSQDRPSLHSSEERLVRAGVDPDVPSPPAPAPPETEQTSEETALAMPPARFEEGKVYTAEQISEALRLCDSYLI